MLSLWSILDFDDDFDNDLNASSDKRNVVKKVFPAKSPR